LKGDSLTSNFIDELPLDKLGAAYLVQRNAGSAEILDFVAAGVSPHVHCHFRALLQIDQDGLD